ncbi:MAG: hypothetical protein Q9195_004986 [Heterodermia aff. obscurata]
MSTNYSSPRTEARSKEDSEDFWKVEADDHEFWEAYVATRPNYSQPFYELIHKYHSRHSPSHTLAQDVGCGAGQVAAEFAQHYTHVVASDTDADHLLVAKGRLAPQFDQFRVSYTHSKAENLASHHPQASADLIAAAEAVFYGRPTFSDPTLFDQAQHILDRIMVLNWTKVIGGSGPRRAWGFKRCADAMESWLDFLPFPSDTWVDVQRYKWNTHGTLPFFGEEACGYKIEPVSNVVDGEKVVVEKDEEFWMNEWDVAAVKEYFRVLFPSFRGVVGDSDKGINELFRAIGCGDGWGGSPETVHLALRACVGE